MKPNIDRLVKAVVSNQLKLEDIKNKGVRTTVENIVNRRDPLEDMVFAFPTKYDKGFTQEEKELFCKEHKIVQKDLQHFRSYASR